MINKMENTIVKKELIIDTNKLILEGENGLNTRKTFFTLIDHIMNDNMTRCFIDEYFNDWDDVKTMVMFIKTYQIVERQIRMFEYTNNKKFDEGERRKLMIGLVKNLITNSESRKEIVKNMNNFMASDYTVTESICKEMVDLKLED